MKTIARTAVIIGAMIISGVVAADFNPKMRSSVGVDYYQAWMEGKGQTQVSGVSFPYNKMFARSFGGGTLYAGLRLHENLGLELGASVSAKKAKLFSVTNSNLTTFSNVRRTEAHLDLVFIFPINACIDVNAAFGLGFMKPKIESWYVNAANITQGIPVSTPGRAILRAGLGASYQLTSSVGMRAKLGWEGTSANRGRVNGVGTAKIFKDTLGLSLGIFARY